MGNHSKLIVGFHEEILCIFCDLVENFDNPKIVLSSIWRNGIARDGTTAVHINDLINAISCGMSSKIDPLFRLKLTHPNVFRVWVSFFIISDFYTVI